MADPLQLFISPVERRLIRKCGRLLELEGVDLPHPLEHADPEIGTELGRESWTKRQAEAQAVVEQLRLAEQTGVFTIADPEAFVRGCVAIRLSLWQHKFGEHSQEAIESFKLPRSPATALYQFLAAIEHYLIDTHLG